MTEIILEAGVENLETLIQFVSNFARARKFPSERRIRIELAVEEALVNIFNHAYKENQTGDVKITCTFRDDADLIVEIRDSGPPFDVHSLTDPDLNMDLSQRPIGGLGVFLMKKMADQVLYRREGDENILTLLVHRH